MKSKKYATGGSTDSNYRPVQGAPKPKPLTPSGAKKPTGAPYAKPTPKPAPKPAVKKPATASKPSYSAVNEIKSRMIPTASVNKPGTGSKPAATTKPGTGKPAPKPTPKPAVKKPTTPAKTTAPAKTVSQLWTEKTGTSWAEAKKQGLSDGSAASNMALMKKLQSGSVNKETIAAMKDNSKVPTLSVKETTVTKSNASPAATTSEKPAAKPSAKQMSGSGMGAMERMEGMYKRGGAVKRMKSKKK